MGRALLDSEQQIDFEKLQNEYLSGFDKVGLEELQEINLMDRVDRKFLFGINHLESLLKEMQGSYQILTIGDESYSNLNSLYVDTRDCHFFKQHHNGKLNRHKVRFRSYQNTQLNYLETKFKTNKGRTQKNRVLRNYGNFETFENNEAGFLNEHIPVKPETLSPKLWVSFTRLHFIHKEKFERLTIDLNLTFEFKEKKESFPEAVIAELKQSKYENDADFAKFMKKRQIRPTPFSKYCVGMCLLHGLKSNRFKRILLNLKKINQRHDDA